MKTKYFFIMLLFTINYFSFAQNVQSDALATSGGLNAGTTTSGSGGNTFYGYKSGAITSILGQANTFIGYESGQNNNNGSGNTLIGYKAGFLLYNGYSNICIGKYSGMGLSNGSGNIFVGEGTGYIASSNSKNNIAIGASSGNGNWGNFKDENIFIGSNSGTTELNIGSQNILIGKNSGYSCENLNNTIAIGSGCGSESNGIYNILIGTNTGYSLTGNNNIIIGNDSAENTVGNNNIVIGYSASDSPLNNSLTIDNSDTANPLILGYFTQNQLKFNAKVGVGFGFGNYPTTIGSENISNYNLFVKGGILTEEVRVSLQSTWADYVFNKDYDLPSLKDVENHIREKGRLINVPSAKEVAENGIELGEMTKIQQEKIEELTLYIIEQNKINQKQNQEIEELKMLVKQLIDKNKQFKS